MMSEIDFVSLAKELMNLPAQQVMVNQACLEDVTSIQVKSSQLLDVFLTQINSPESFQAEPEVRMSNIIGLLTQQQKDAKAFKDRLTYWSRQDKLVGVVHEIVANTTAMVNRVSKTLEESLAELKEAVAQTDALMGLIALIDKLDDQPAQDMGIASTPDTRTLH